MEVKIGIGYRVVDGNGVGGREGTIVAFANPAPSRAFRLAKVRFDGFIQREEWCLTDYLHVVEPTS